MKGRRAVRVAVTAAGGARDVDPAPPNWLTKSTSLAGSVGTTPHLVGVEHLRIFLSQSIAQIQALIVFEKYFSLNQFHLFHRSLDLKMRSKKCQKIFFLSCFNFSICALGFPTCRRCVGVFPPTSRPHPAYISRCRQRVGGL